MGATPNPPRAFPGTVRDFSGAGTSKIGREEGFATTGMMEVAGGNPAAGADIEPGEDVRSGRQIQVQFGRSVAIEIDGVHTRGRRKNSRINTLGMLDRMPVR